MKKPQSNDLVDSLKRIEPLTADATRGALDNLPVQERAPLSSDPIDVTELKGMFKAPKGKTVRIEDMNPGKWHAGMPFFKK
jgi:hypothetical protein